MNHIGGDTGEWTVDISQPYNGYVSTVHLAREAQTEKLQPVPCKGLGEVGEKHPKGQDFIRHRIDMGIAQQNVL